MLRRLLLLIPAAATAVIVVLPAVAVLAADDAAARAEDVAVGDRRLDVGGINRDGPHRAGIVGSDLAHLDPTGGGREGVVIGRARVGAGAEADGCTRAEQQQ